MTYRLDTNSIHLHDNQIEDLLIHYGSYGDFAGEKLSEFVELYLKYYPENTRKDAWHVYKWIRLAKGLSLDVEGVY